MLAYPYMLTTPFITMRTLFLLWFVFTTNLFQAQIIVEGRVLSEETKQPLAFVNIGIVNKSVGCVSSEDGHFTLSVPDSLKNSVLKFSIIGFHTKTYKISEVKQLAGIYLSTGSQVLEEITVSAKATQTKILGNKTKDKKNKVSMFQNAVSGSETAVKLDIKHKNTFLKKVFFNVVSSNVDQALLRLNIYRIGSEGMPGSNLLKKSIVKKVPLKEGFVYLDISADNIWVDEPVFISLEMLSGISSNNQVYISTKMNASETFTRRTSQDKWDCIRNFGLGIQVEVNY